jgi:hypothetical protein
MAAQTFDKAVELAGFFLAHAVLSVQEGGALIPMVAFEQDGKRNMVRFAAEDLADGVASARAFLEMNEPNAEHAVLVCDAYVTYGDVKKDTLLASVVEYHGAKRSLTIGIPYTPGKGGNVFAVHKPKFLEQKGLESELNGLGEALFRGVDAHEEGGQVWTAALDQSF